MNTKNLSDEELVIKTLNDVDYFGSLMDRYEGKLLRYILRISSFSSEEAEEILQEVFIKAWKNLQDFDASVKFSSWIFRIAHNQTISEFRKHKARGLDQKINLEEEEFVNLASKIEVESETSKKIKAQKVRKILRKLPEKYRIVLVLKFLEEKSTAEISDILQKPEKTISTLIHRAKKYFKNESEELRNNV